MTLRKKFILRIVIILSLILAFTMAINAFSFRKYGIHNADKTGKIVAKLVESGLTAHMMTGTMGMRHYFLDQIRSIEGIEKLWVIRGEPVIRQFGKGNNYEAPKDELDLKAIQTGKIQRKLIENMDTVKYRITIPYIATSSGKINCLQCHQVNEGEVLGAISIVTDISDVRAFAFSTTKMILLASVIIFILAGLYMYRFIGKYVDIFEKLKTAMGKAIKGDFSARINTNLKDEAGQTAIEFNRFMEELNQNFDEIKKVMKALAEADLTKRINRRMEGEFETLRQNINKSIQSLANTLHITLEGFSSILTELERITQQIIRISEDIKEENTNIQEIKNSIYEIKERIKAIYDSAEKAQKLGAQIKDEITSGEQNIKELEEYVSALIEAGENIKSMTKNILEIANQTNLLALNAAVEAARAGESGKGFAVVADEVRQLAENTSNFARKVQSVVDQVFENIKKARSSLNKTHTGYTQMAANYDRMSELMDEIARAISIQSQHISKMSENIEKISQISQHNTQENQEITEKIKQMYKTAEEIQEEVKKFKLEGE
ncbi:methyl-accepting chemotaxis protein [Persephonella sp. KM09-Lau-8]|uniref:methyl-accepting chemotaxis protein n=1 Tax=Persephonella sp. KM09-Lau-8 TaxID=1158345 RepID=UPI00049536AC|nr:methyl-accepting chemotaxis protein [Persephonella sp. KM09-Lau-8]